MRQVKDILSTIINTELSLNLLFKTVTTNADGHFVCTCENTQYLNVGKTVVIDGVTYRVEAFSFNASLTLSGASSPTAGLVYQIARPTFVYGKYKDVHAQVAAMNIKDSMPMIWMFELLERSQPEDELSSIDSEGDVRLYFFNSMQNDWETSDHYTEVFDPLTNLIDAFVNACKSSPLLGEIGRVARTNHAKFATGGQTISGGDERQIMPAYLSAIEVLIGIPVLSYCGTLPDTTCAPGNLYNPSGALITQIPSGGSFTLDAGSGAVRNSDSSYENTVDVGETLVLPDITVTDVDGSTRTVPSVQDVVCVVPAPDVIYNRPSQCIQVVSYISGDSRDTAAEIYEYTASGSVNSLDQGAVNPFNTLLLNDPLFNAKTRITDKDGNDVYGDDTERIRFDNLQGIICDTNSRFSDVRDSLANHLATAAAKSETINGRTYSNWYVMPMEYMIGLVEETNTNRINNTLGSGIAPLLNTQKGLNEWYYVNNNLNNGGTFAFLSGVNLPAIYFAFIEDYV